MTPGAAVRRPGADGRRRQLVDRRRASGPGRDLAGHLIRRLTPRSMTASWAGPTSSAITATRSSPRTCAAAVTPTGSGSRGSASSMTGTTPSSGSPLSPGAPARSGCSAGLRGVGAVGGCRPLPGSPGGDGDRLAAPGAGSATGPTGSACSGPGDYMEWLNLTARRVVQPFPYPDWAWMIGHQDPDPGRGLRSPAGVLLGVAPPLHLRQLLAFTRRHRL